jgi:hypothetical protein
MPPNEKCPNCHLMVEDWHVEWYRSETSTLYKGLVAMDCPLCGQAVGFQQGMIGPAPPGVPLVRRYAEKAAEWAAFQAVAAGGTLQGYTSSAGAGVQYVDYWTSQEILQADVQEQAKKQGRDMILTPQEKAFLDVFLHEATTSPFTGPATKALHQIGVEYSDISYIAWGYEQDVPHTSWGWGHAAEVSPPVPWANRESVLRRNMEIKRIWEQNQKPVGTPKGI